MSIETQKPEGENLEIPAFNAEAFMQAEVSPGDAIIPEVKNDDGIQDAPKTIIPKVDVQVPAEKIIKEEEGKQKEEEENEITYDADFSNINPKESSEEIKEEDLMLIGKSLGVSIESKEDLDNLRAKLQSDKPKQEMIQDYSYLNLSKEDAEIVKHSDNVLSKIKNYSDEDMLGFQLKQLDPDKYADEDELEYQIKNIKDSGLLQMQADTIRKSIIDSAKAQKNTIIKSAEKIVENSNLTRSKELEASIKSYKDGFHGIKLSPKQALEVFQKVSDNTLFNEIESSQANVAEMAMLWETRDMIYKALDNPSLQPGIKKFFNELSNVQMKPASGKQVLSDPTEFNPAAFMSSDGFKTA